MPRIAAPVGGGSDQGVCICDAWHFKWECTEDGVGKQPGEADSDEHAATGGEPGEMRENRGARRRQGAGGGDPTEPLRGKRVEAVP